MFNRPALILACAVAAVTLAACKSTYSNVYSFKKNSFVAPTPAPTAAMPTLSAADQLGLQQSAPTAVPGMDASIPGAAPTGIPGLDGPGAAPAPPAPEAAPAIPGL